MENEVLALGQIELTAETSPEAFSAAEAELCKVNGYTPEDVLQFVKESGPQTLNAAIGGMKTSTNQVLNAMETVEEVPEGVENVEVEAEKLPESDVAVE